MFLYLEMPLRITSYNVCYTKLLRFLCLIQSTRFFFKILVADEAVLNDSLVKLMFKGDRTLAAGVQGQFRAAGILLGHYTGYRD